MCSACPRWSAAPCIWQAFVSAAALLSHATFCILCSAGHRQVWHNRHVLDDLRAQCRRLRGARDRAEAAGVILRQVASLPLFRRGRHGEIADRIVPASDAVVATLATGTYVRCRARPTS